MLQIHPALLFPDPGKGSERENKNLSTLFFPEPKYSNAISPVDSVDGNGKKRLVDNSSCFVAQTRK